MDQNSSIHPSIGCASKFTKFNSFVLTSISISSVNQQLIDESCIILNVSIFSLFSPSVCLTSNRSIYKLRTHLLWRVLSFMKCVEWTSWEINSDNYFFYHSLSQCCMYDQYYITPSILFHASNLMSGAIGWCPLYREKKARLYKLMQFFLAALTPVQKQF